VKETKVNFVAVKKDEPPPPKKEPPPPKETPKPRRRPPRSSTCRSCQRTFGSPAEGVQGPAPPVNVPTNLPTIDLSKAITNENDFSGKGVAGGDHRAVSRVARARKGTPAGTLVSKADHGPYMEVPG